MGDRILVEVAAARILPSLPMLLLTFPFPAKKHPIPPISFPCANLPVFPPLTPPTFLVVVLQWPPYD